MDNLLKTIKSRHNSRAAGIMIDVDDFKKINDTLGHSAGDNALLDVSHIICSAVPEKAYVMRYAGDEFVVVAPDSDIHEVSMIAGNIQNALRDFNANNKRDYELSLSIGSAEMADEQAFDDAVKDQAIIKIFLKIVLTNGCIKKSCEKNANGKL